ncbi:MAG: GNAT family N-acetyltransferase [Bacteroides sp.]|nr:GNAT family N-acetyltransferase [Bacteroides sp.]
MIVQENSVRGIGALSKRISLRNLWKDTFGDSDRYLDLIFNNLYEESFSLISDASGHIITAGEAAAGLLGIPYNYVDTASGTTFRGLYLCGLATRPNYRRRGIMQRLLEVIERIAASDSFDFLFLIPADSHLRKYYEKEGFQSVFYRQKIVIDRLGLNKILAGIESESITPEKTPNLILPILDQSYMHIAREEAATSGGEILLDPVDGSEAFVFEIENTLKMETSEKRGKVTYFSVTGRNGFKNILTELCSRFESIEFSLPYPTPSPFLSVLSTHASIPSKEEQYAMLKTLYENPKFTDETSVDLKKSILAHNPILAYLMLD